MLLVDSGSGRGYLRLRRDLTELSEEDADVLDGLAEISRRRPTNSRAEGCLPGSEKMLRTLCA